MYRSFRTRAVLIFAAAVTAMVGACQAPTQPSQTPVSKSALLRPHFDVDSLSCPYGYSVINGIVSCN